MRSILPRARDVAVLGDADLVPGGQALDVRREVVLAHDRDAHAEDGLHEQGVGAGRAGAVDVRELDREVVYSVWHLERLLAVGAAWRRRRGFVLACGHWIVDFCMSQAAVGQRSAHRPQCTHRSSSLTMTRPVCCSGRRYVQGLSDVHRRRLEARAQLGLLAVRRDGEALHRADVDAGVALDAQLGRRTPSARRS